MVTNNLRSTNRVTEFASHDVWPARKDTDIFTIIRWSATCGIEVFPHYIKPATYGINIATIVRWSAIDGIEFFPIILNQLHMV